MRFIKNLKMRFEKSILSRTSGRHKACLSFEDYSGKKILDVGASYGWFEKLSDAKRVVAIDPNRRDIEKAKEEVQKKNIQFEVAGVFDVEKLGKDFDFAVLFDVIEHIPAGSEKKAIEGIKKVLKKNGKIVISTPADNFSKFFDPAWYFGHRHYTSEKLKKILESSGFKVEKSEIRGGFFEIFSMTLFYPLKWLVDSEIPFKSWFDKKRDQEYLKRGFVTLFVSAKKTT